MHTRQSVRDLIQSRWESDLPDRVLHALQPYAGKPITSRLLSVLPGSVDSSEEKVLKYPQWRMRRQFGWTEIVTADYERTSGRSGMRLNIARSERSVPLDLAYVEKENPAYFAGRRKRNHARMEAMNTRETLDAIAEAMNAAELAIKCLDRAAARIEELAGHGTTLNPEYYAIRRLCGLEDIKHTK